MQSPARSKRAQYAVTCTEQSELNMQSPARSKESSICSHLHGAKRAQYAVTCTEQRELNMQSPARSKESSICSHLHGAKRAQYAVTCTEQRELNLQSAYGPSGVPFMHSQGLLYLRTVEPGRGCLTYFLCGQHNEIHYSCNLGG